MFDYQVIQGYLADYLFYYLKTLKLSKNIDEMDKEVRSEAWSFGFCNQIRRSPSLDTWGINHILLFMWILTIVARQVLVLRSKISLYFRCILADPKVVKLIFWVEYHLKYLKLFCDAHFSMHYVWKCLCMLLQICEMVDQGWDSQFKPIINEARNP